MNRILLTLLFLSTLIFTIGCSITPKYQVTIDAITAKNASLTPSTYIIKALDNKKNNAGLVFQQYSERLAQTLHQKGYLKITKGEIAKQFIYFDYGLEKVNEETETYSEPDITFHMGYGHPFGGYYGGHPFFRSFHGGGFGGGYNTYSKTRVYYNRYIILLAKDQFNKELWRVDVSSVGESKNLRKIIPILIKASEPYLGANTTEPLHIVIKEQAKKK